MGKGVHHPAGSPHAWCSHCQKNVSNLHQPFDFSLIACFDPLCERGKWAGQIQLTLFTNEKNHRERKWEGSHLIADKTKMKNHFSALTSSIPSNNNSLPFGILLEWAQPRCFWSYSRWGRCIAIPDEWEEAIPLALHIKKRDTHTYKYTYTQSN